MSELTEFRKSKDDFFASGGHSPLMAQQRGRFKGLEYYTENSDLRFELTIDELADAQKERVDIATSTGDFQPYLRWGTITFLVEGESATLSVYQSEDGGDFFLPFADASSGHETYGSGRYLDVLSLHGGKVLVDFNYAYNPYCAYNPNWSCPIPPLENRLKVPIRAGEKTFPDVAHD